MANYQIYNLTFTTKVRKQNRVIISPAIIDAAHIKEGDTVELKLTAVIHKDQEGNM